MVNHMVQQLDRTFAALGHPTRRAIVERLGRGSASAQQLAEPFDVSLTAVLKHVRVLEDAGLVSCTKSGRVRHCGLVVEALDEQAAWIDRQRALWTSRLDAIGRLLEDET